MSSAFTVSKFILMYSHEKGQSMSVLRLQKVLYYVQAAFLINGRGPCFPEEIEAWDYGPTIPGMRNVFSVYGAGFIPVSGSMPPDAFGISKEDQELIEQVVDRTAKYSTLQLVDFTKSQTPWITAYRKRKRTVISNVNFL